MDQLEMPPGVDSPSELAALLSDECRQEIPVVLRDANAPLAVADLATELARTEQEAEGKPDPDTVQRCYTLLYHVHLPKLADVGVVEFDLDDRRVTLAE